MHPPVFFRQFRIILLIALSTLSGCSFFSSPPARINPADENQVMANLNNQKTNEALAGADKMVAGAPEDFQAYQTRSTVYLALRQYDAAQADNVKALQLVEAGKADLPKEKQPAVLAQIHENMALTALIAAQRAPDDIQYQRWIKVFQEQADIVKTLDPTTWTHMRGMVESSDKQQ